MSYMTQEPQTHSALLLLPAMQAAAESREKMLTILNIYPCKHIQICIAEGRGVTFSNFKSKNHTFTILLRWKGSGSKQPACRD